MTGSGSWSKSGLATSRWACQGGHVLLEAVPHGVAIRLLVPEPGVGEHAFPLEVFVAVQHSRCLGFGQ